MHLRYNKEIAGNVIVTEKMDGGGVKKNELIDDSWISGFK